MNPTFAMSNVKALCLVPVLFAAAVSVASEAAGQACTPVVYAFRHGEETKPPNPPGPIASLVPTGMAHAALYPGMVAEFGATKGYCPVVKVYATAIVDKLTPCGNACASTTNPYDTGTPLAKAIMNANPITSVGGNVLYEYLGNGNDAPSSPKYDKPAGQALRDELIATARTGKSSAIFWTSQGLHVLGGVIINATSQVPDKNANPPSVPPRNAVYVFKAVDGNPITAFKDISSPTKYVQCYNHMERRTQPPQDGPRFIDPTIDPATYYCGYAEQANLGGTLGDCPVGDQCGSSIPNDEPPPPAGTKSNKDIRGKICDTTELPVYGLGAGFFGGCN